MRRPSGFTLIELLVALAIFGVLAALSLRAIAMAAEQRTFVEDESRKWRDLDRLFATVEADLGAALQGTAGFVGRAAPDGDGVWLRLSIAGRSGSGDAPMPPRAVSHRLVDGHPVRTSGSENAGPAAPNASIRYPSKVAALRARYLSARGEWLGTWQTNDGSLPRAVEISLQLASREEVRRVLLVQ